MSSEASCSPGMKRTSFTASAETISRKRFMRSRRSLAIVGGVGEIAGEDDEVGLAGRPFTVATAFASVCSASGFAAPL